MTSHRHFRCRFCGVTLSAWYPVPGEPNGTVLFHHMSQSHPAEVRRYRDQMRRTEDITRIIVQAYEVVEAPEQEA
jgi:hypothetical protein